MSLLRQCFAVLRYASLWDVSGTCGGVQECPSEDLLESSAAQLVAFGLDLENVFEEFIESVLPLLLRFCRLQ